jgi:hypothetical protein
MLEKPFIRKHFKNIKNIVILRNENVLINFVCFINHLSVRYVHTV